MTATMISSRLWLDLGTAAPMTNWAQKSPNNAAASRVVSDRLARMATANTDWAAVRRSSSRWRATIGRPDQDDDAMAKTTGRVPTSSVHWLTLDDTSVPRPALVLSRHAYRPATSSSGASEASGASHWTRKNSLIPNVWPVSTRAVAKCSAQARITIAAATNRPTTDARRRATVNVPIRAAGPTRCGSSAGALEIRTM